MWYVSRCLPSAAATRFSWLRLAPLFNGAGGAGGRRLHGLPPPENEYDKVAQYPEVPPHKTDIDVKVIT